MEMKNVVIKNNGFASKLFRMGHELVDFEQSKIDLRKTVFTFKEDGTVQSDLDVMINSIVKR